MAESGGLFRRRYAILLGFGAIPGDMEWRLQPVPPADRVVPEDVPLRLSETGVAAREDRRDRVGLDVECWVCWLYGLESSRTRGWDAVRDGRETEVKAARRDAEYRLRREQFRRLRTHDGMFVFVAYRRLTPRDGWYLRVERVWCVSARLLARVVDWRGRWRTRWHDGLGWGQVADVGTAVMTRHLSECRGAYDVTP